MVRGQDPVFIITKSSKSRDYFKSLFPPVDVQEEVARWHLHPQDMLGLGDFPSAEGGVGTGLGM